MRLHYIQLYCMVQNDVYNNNKNFGSYCEVCEGKSLLTLTLKSVDILNSLSA